MKCGVGDYSNNLAKALIIDPDIQIGILTSSSVGEMNTPEGITMFPVIIRWSLYEATKVMEVIKNWAPDIVHIQYPTLGYGNGWLPCLLPIISFLMGKKVVQTWHEGFARRDLVECILKSIIPTRLVFVRPQYKEYLHYLLRWVLWGKKWEFIPNASSIPNIKLSDGEKIRIKNLYIKKQNRLIVFFGFIYPHKGVDLLFEIADSTSDQIVVAGEIQTTDDYQQEIMRRASVEPWIDKVTITGFLPAADVAALLAVADAVILPFRIGGGGWNTSIHGAVSNGAFVIATSLTQNGYDQKSNVYYAKVDDIQEMRSALATYAGIRREYHPEIDRDSWQYIAHKHRSIYEDLLSR